MTLKQKKQLDAARTKSWTKDWKSARRDVRKAARKVKWKEAKSGANAAAEYAALDITWDTILALLVRDKITPEQFDILYQPWKQVMEDTAK